jgi:protein-L-isoaspartate(D-aspartate) O-methyltransferase
MASPDPPIARSPDGSSWIDRQLRARDIVDERVLAAMTAVPREAFVPPAETRDAYEDTPLPIGHGQTISQPYIVAWMTQELGIEPGSRVLEIGTGSGYQTAILAAMGAEVYSLEIIAQLSARAGETLARLGFHHVHLRVGSGYDGWTEAAPFDRILVTAAPPRVPAALTDQLAAGGRLIVPVGEHEQLITVIDRIHGELRTRVSIAVRFVPMVRIPPP